MTRRSVQLSSALIVSLFLAWGCTILGAQDKRLSTLESKVESLQKSQEKSRADISAQVEEINNTLSLLESELEEMHIDFSTLQSLLISQSHIDSVDEPGEIEGAAEGDTGEGAGESASPGGKEHGRADDLIPVSTAPLMEGEESAILSYQYAMEAYNLESYQEAITRFKEFISHFPTHHFADNAQYWIGECYYSLGQYERSIDEFCAILQDHENASKVPDALLKVGLACLKLQAPERARPYLLQLIEKYPLTEAAGKARQVVGKNAE